jgi:hypothetical protein
MKCERILQRQKRSNRDWLLREGAEAIREEDLKYIESNLQYNDPAVRSNIADCLDRLGIWYATAGQVALIDGSPEGWTEIHRSWLYRCRSLQLQISGFQKGRVLGRFRPIQSLALEANPSALCLAYALVVDSEFEVRFFGDTLRVMLMDNDIVRADYWHSYPLVPFLVHLLAFAKRQQLEDLKSWADLLGPFQSIVEAWNEPLLLSKAIHEVCEFHCQRIEDESDEFFAEFRSPPFDLVAAEVQAIYAVRRNLGLETPQVTHPLLQPPFDVPRGSSSDIRDDLLDRVEASAL